MNEDKGGDKIMASYNRATRTVIVVLMFAIGYLNIFGQQLNDADYEKIFRETIPITTRLGTYRVDVSKLVDLGESVVPFLIKSKTR